MRQLQQHDRLGWYLLLERGMTKSQMRIEAGLTTNVLANMNKGQHISMESLIRICDAYIYSNGNSTLQKGHMIMVLGERIRKNTHIPGLYTA